jgi:hypothetical protein
MINTIIDIAYYSGISLLIFLGAKFIYGLIKREKLVYLKSLRLLVNIGVILTFCWGAFMYFAIIVRPPSEITESKEQSLDNLNQWIINQELKIGFIGIIIIGVLGLLSHLYLRKFEKTDTRKPIRNMTLINCVILMITLFLIYGHTYSGLAVEVGYHF